METAFVKVSIEGSLTEISISGDVLAALESCACARQGTPIRGASATPVARATLEGLGLIGPSGGLTRRGSYAYLDIQDQLDATYGY